MATVLEVLVEARELISVEERWTQSQYAKDATGAGVDPNTDEAVCFCSLGALANVTGEFSLREVFLTNGPRLVDRAYAMLDCAARQRFEDGVIGVNDRYERPISHERVLEVYDDAILAARISERVVAA